MTQDFDTKESLEKRFPMIEIPSDVIIDADERVAAVQARKPPRFIKTHLSYQFLPTSISKGKIIYVARNPKDTVCSLFNFFSNLQNVNYLGDLDDLAEEFVADLVVPAPGPFSSHVKSYWQHKDDPNMLFITFEDMKRDHKGHIRKIAKFLGKKLSDEQIDRIAEATGFEAMRNNPAVNYSWLKDSDVMDKANPFQFIRKGEIGSWKNELSPRSVKLLDKYVNDHFSNTPIKFFDGEKMLPE